MIQCNLQQVSLPSDVRSPFILSECLDTPVIQRIIDEAAFLIFLTCAGRSSFILPLLRQRERRLKRRGRKLLSYHFFDEMGHFGRSETMKGESGKSIGEVQTGLKLKINERLNITTLYLNNQINQRHQQQSLAQQRKPHHSTATEVLPAVGSKMQQIAYTHPGKHFPVAFHQLNEDL